MARHRIDKSAFQKGVYVGYADGVWHIRKNGRKGWIASHREHKHSPISGETLDAINEKLSRIEPTKTNPRKGKKMRRRHSIRRPQHKGRINKNPKGPLPAVVRKPSNDDLHAAARGLRMWGMSVDELIELFEEHRSKPLFASKVIAEAAKQIAVSKGAKLVARKRK